MEPPAANITAEATSTDTNDVTSEPSDVTCEVLVIGAGVSGLTAATELLKRDAAAQICVVEAKGQC